MTNRDFEITYQTTCHQIIAKEMNLAFENLFKMASEVSDQNSTEKLNAQRTNYLWMLKYAVTGVNDPQQDNIYNQLQCALLECADGLRNLFFTKYSNNIVFEKKRNSGVPNLNTSRTYDSLNDFSDTFQHLWLTDKYTEEETIIKLIQTSCPEPDSCAFVTAITLSLLRSFDEKKFHVLLMLLASHQTEVRQRALVGLLFCITQHHKRIPLYKQLYNRIKLTMEEDALVENTQNTLLQIILSSETEKITKKMNEAIPTIIKEKFKGKPFINIDELMNDTNAMSGENPEWQSFLDKSGMGDKIMELSKLQSEGGDIFMSTFASLKNYSFFNNIENWFLPFCNHPIVEKNNNGNDFEEIKKLVGHSMFLCNSDKYSLCFSIMQMPGNYLSMIKDTFRMEKEQTEELMKEQKALDRFSEEKIKTKMYIHDLFRFYNLHPNRSDFANPFKKLQDIHDKLLLEDNPHYTKILKTLSDYYIKREMFEEALQTMKELENRATVDLDLLQKCAFCHQKMKQYEEALAYYKKAEIMQPNTLWNMQRIAYCEKCLGALDSSLEHYQQCAELAPDDLTIQQSIGYCLISQQKYAEALKIFFKIDYLQPENWKAAKAIGWCSFATNKIEQAERYYMKTPEMQRTEHDDMNIGHIHLCQGKIEMAALHYKRAFLKLEKDKSKFIALFKEDVNHLESYNIDTNTLHLILDYILFEIEKE